MKNSYFTVTDQFCGAGGSSQGIRELSRENGGGIEVKLALNHWKLAIETHNTNFPNTLHDCTDISACDPRRYPKTNMLITSPECTNHSLAKGKKRKQSADLFSALNPEEERSRATMWDVPRFAEYHNYEIIIVENVVDARYWIMWDAWIKAMHLLGYLHKCVYLNSMHAHPTPQSRDRMYVVFWKKGNKAPDLAMRPIGFCNHCQKDTETYQAWKNQNKQWGKYRTQYVYRCPSCNHIVEPYYYAAFNCIDWSNPGTRIGDTGILPQRFLIYVDGDPGHGKTEYQIQFAKVLATHYGKVRINNVEQGKHVQIRDSVRRNQLDKLKAGRFAYCSIKDFDKYKEQLRRPNSGRVQIIDSISYFPLDEKQIQELFETFKKKSFILVGYKAHYAKNASIRHLCDTKIRVENFVAQNNGNNRFGGSKDYVIWDRPKAIINGQLTIG